MKSSSSTKYKKIDHTILSTNREKRNSEKEEASLFDEIHWKVQEEREAFAQASKVASNAFDPEFRSSQSLSYHPDVMWNLLQSFKKYWFLHHYDDNRVIESVMMVENNLNSFYDFLLFQNPERENFDYLEMRSHLVPFVGSFFSLLTRGERAHHFDDNSRLHKFSLEEVKALFLRDVKLLMIHYVKNAADLKKKQNDLPAYYELIQEALTQAKSCYHELFATAYTLELCAQNAKCLTAKMYLRETQMHDLKYQEYLLKLIDHLTEVLQVNGIEFLSKPFHKNTYFERLSDSLRQDFYCDYNHEDGEKLLLSLLTPLFWQQDNKINLDDRQKKDFLVFINTFKKDKPLLYLNTLFQGIDDSTLLGKIFSTPEDRKVLLLALNEFLTHAPNLVLKGVIPTQILKHTATNRQLIEQVRGYPPLYAILAVQLQLPKSIPSSSSSSSFQFGDMRAQLTNIINGVQKSVEQACRQLNR